MTFYKNNFSKNGIIALILAMLFVVPNLNVYSSLGAYTTKSQGLRANNNPNKKKRIGPPQNSFWLNILANAVYDAGKYAYNHPAEVAGWTYNSTTNVAASVYILHPV